MFLSGNMHWHAVLAERLLRRRLHARRRLPAATSARTTCSTSAAASRSPATSGSKRSSSRRSCSARRGRLSVLGGWREATQVNFYGLGQRPRSRRTWSTTASRSRTSAPSSKCSRRGSCSSSRGGVEVSQWNQGAGSGSSPSVEQSLHAGDAAGPRRVAGLPPHAGRPSASTRGRRAATRAAAGSTA